MKGLVPFHICLNQGPERVRESLRSHSGLRGPGQELQGAPLTHGKVTDLSPRAASFWSCREGGTLPAIRPGSRFQTKTSSRPSSGP